jgi:hypothetical protein
MRTFTRILLALVASTDFAVQAIQYSVTLARRPAATERVAVAMESCETALGFQRSLHLSQRQPRALDAVGVPQISKFEGASVFGLQRAMKVSKRQVNASLPVGVQSNDGAALGLRRSTLGLRSSSMQLKKRAAFSTAYFADEPSCLLGLQQSMEITRRTSDDASSSLLGLSTLGLQRSVQVMHYKAVA